MRLKEYEVYRESGYLDLVCVIRAGSYDEAVWKARKMGYDQRNYRIEEVEDDG